MHTQRQTPCGLLVPALPQTGRQASAHASAVAVSHICRVSGVIAHLGSFSEEVDPKLLIPGLMWHQDTAGGSKCDIMETLEINHDQHI